ncbi:alpha/beta hydrolase [Streptomyces sp. NPDC059071]|uniref:alpha/beta hydrolase n=1 Tax=unclassified Streptomyces TaxID=2593676 RepID=UPI00366884AE
MSEHFSQLMKQDFADLDSAATSWKKLAEALGRTQTGSGKRVTGPLHKAEWAGVSATYGFGAMEATESKLGTAQINVQLIATTLDALNTKMQAAQRKLRAAVADAEGAGHRVRDDGWVEAKQAVDPAYRNDPDYQGAQERANAGLGGFRARIDEAVTEATKASAEAAEVLRQIDPFDLDKRYGGASAREDASRVAAFVGIDKKDIPDGKDPQRSADWWAGLDEGERRFYLAAFPEQLGALDGLPATARDQANRTVLDTRINDYALREGDLGHHDRYGYRSLLAMKDRLDRSDTAAAHKQLYLLGFSTEKDGRAIVSVGNPDTARHTAVSVAGTSNQLDNFGDQIGRAEKLQDAAGRWSEGHGTDVAVISWLDYDAPEANVDPTKPAEMYLNLGIATPGRAEDDAETLRDFTHGLRASHQGERTHLTVEGHSYGSTMVGAADAGGRGLDADDMIVVGSPGLTVDRADQLHVSPSHLWAGAAPDDQIVNWTAGKTLGADPKEPDFGGQRMYVDTSGHSGYWDDHSQSLENQGRVIAGLALVNRPRS